MAAPQSDAREGKSTATSSTVTGTGTVEIEDALVDTSITVRAARRDNNPERYAVTLGVRTSAGASVAVSLTPGGARELSGRLETAADEYEDQ